MIIILGISVLLSMFFLGFVFITLFCNSKYPLKDEKEDIVMGTVFLFGILVITLIGINVGINECLLDWQNVYLKKEALEKWDGKMPNAVGGQSISYLLDLKEGKK